MFDSYFVKCRNIIFEQAKFNQRVKKEGKAADSLICILSQSPVDTREEMIWDQIVIGILNSRLSKQMQLDAGLKSETAITKARHSEPVKQQQSTFQERN